MRHALAVLGLLVLASLPASAASYYFSDCGCDPAGTAKQADACNRPTLADAYCAGDFSDSGTFYCGKTCGGFPPICLDACTGATAVATFNCGGAIPNGGQLANPWCLAPESLPNGTVVSTRNSFAAMQDGGAGSNLTTELAAGDTVNLCAGYCDGQGSATWYIQPGVKTCVGGSNAGATCSTGGDCNSGSCVLTTFLGVRNAGTDSSHQITIQPYPGETVALVGDSNHNGIWDSGEVVSWMKGNTTAPNVIPNWWKFEGDPNNTGTTHLSFGKVNGSTTPAMFDVAGNFAGLGNFTMHGVEVYGDVPAIWNGADFGGVQGSCNSGDGAYTLHFDNMNTGTVSITNNYFHDICGILNRLNRNNTIAMPTASVFKFDNNRVVNVGSVSSSNVFSIRGQYDASTTAEVIGNTITDSGGITFRDNYQHVTVTDNTIKMTGRIINGTNEVAIAFRNEDAGPNCTQTCSISGDDCGNIGACAGGAGSCTGPADCSMDDIYVARNLILGAAHVAYAQPALPNPGDIITGINITGYYNHGGATAYPTRFVIENNMIGYQQERVDGSQCGSLGGAGIYWQSPTTGGVIRNNTLYKNSHPAILCNGPVAFTDNIVAAGGNPVILNAGATASTIQYNDLYGPSTILNNNGTTYACAAAATIGTGDICSAPIFATCDNTTYCSTISGAPSTWDLHLSGAQACVDAGASCSCLDFESQARPGVCTTTVPTCDIGADEWFSSFTANPSFILLPLPPPSSAAR
jgi:hypothetical protein